MFEPIFKKMGLDYYYTHKSALFYTGTMSTLKLYHGSPIPQVGVKGHLQIATTYHLFSQGNPLSFNPLPRRGEEG
jgi:hypothetical protein